MRLTALPAKPQKFRKEFSDAERVRENEALSRAGCASCHLWPATDILDRENCWNGPLPWMMSVMVLENTRAPAAGPASPANR